MVSCFYWLVRKGYLIGNEIACGIQRWDGIPRLGFSLRSLANKARMQLCTYPHQALASKYSSVVYDEFRVEESLHVDSIKKIQSYLYELNLIDTHLGTLLYPALLVFMIFIPREHTSILRHETWSFVFEFIDKQARKEYRLASRYTRIETIKLPPRTVELIGKYVSAQTIDPYLQGRLTIGIHVHLELHFPQTSPQYV